MSEGIDSPARPPEDPPPHKREWALYAYLCGDNKQMEAHTEAQRDAIYAVGASPHVHIAVQWDLPRGAGRAIASDAGGAWTAEEDLGPLNTGEPKQLTRFLEWAFERCPANHVAVVLSGTGLLDARASTGQPDTDRNRIFTIADDATAQDALALSELRSALDQALASSPRERIDLLAFDMRELQFIEVAYELDGVVDLLVAPQTRVPDMGWNFRAVLEACRERVSTTTTPHEMASVIVETVGREYGRASDGELSLSALDLSFLDNVATAFDTLSLGMLHSLGEELVWEARAEVARQLKKEPRNGADNAVAAESSAAQEEEEWLYDLGEMLTRLKTELDRSARGGLGRLLHLYLARLDATQLRMSLISIDHACFGYAAQPRVAGLDRCIAHPQDIRRRLRRLIRRSESLRPLAQDTVARQTLQREIEILLTLPSSSPVPDRTWLDDWPAEVIDGLDKALAAEYRVARRQQQRAQHLAQLAARVLTLLIPSAHEEQEEQGARQGLVFAHTVAGPEAASGRHCGVSLFRPRELDYLSASDYLDLQFNKRIHWTVLLAVVNLIGKHPRALWRILSGALATADNVTRAELLGRVVGPDSVVASFREQFLVLAPVAAMTLSLEADVSANERAAPPRGRSAPLPAARAYRVRLERVGREPLIDEATSLVDVRATQDVLETLVTLLRASTLSGPEEVQLIEERGRDLGEDILRHIGVKLGEEARRPHSGGLHLQLQLPRSLMPYPWELVQHQHGWLSEHFAVGRQVFSGTRRMAGRTRTPGPLRVLVIANPMIRPQDGAPHIPPLPAATEEGKTVLTLFRRLNSETDGLIDFDPGTDAFINADVTNSQVRALLRSRRYDIIHFAGHAHFDPDVPERSSWLLSDGPLTAQSLSTLFEWSELQPWLVYANACEAGMDAQHPDYQREVFGLASAFLNNGVAAYIAPLWPINDDIAAALAHQFYEELLRHRNTVGESLRRARVCAKEKYYDPVRDGGTAIQGVSPSTVGVTLLSWAGLVLYGNSTATIGQRIGAPTSAEQEHHGRP